MANTRSSSHAWGTSDLAPASDLTGSDNESPQHYPEPTKVSLEPAWAGRRNPENSSLSEIRADASLRTSATGYEIPPWSINLWFVTDWYEAMLDGVIGSGRYTPWRLSATC